MRDALSKRYQSVNEVSCYLGGMTSKAFDSMAQDLHSYLKLLDTVSENISQPEVRRSITTDEVLLIVL